MSLHQISGISLKTVWQSCDAVPMYRLITKFKTARSPQKN